METALISVIIPVYNVEKYLRECLDSVLAQTYANFEVILVDDGSTDSSGAICDEYAARDDRFRVIHKENGGLSVARNTGMADAKGEFVYFLDSDDLIEPDALESLISSIEHAKADFVFFEAESFRDDGCAAKQGYLRDRDHGTLDGMAAFESLAMDKDFKSAVPTYFWKKRFLAENKLSFYPGILYEDLLFSFEAFCKAQTVSHCHRTLYKRRIREGSIVTSKPGKKNFESFLAVFSEVVRIARENSVEDQTAVVDYIGRCGMRVIETYSILESDDKKSCRAAYSDFIADVRREKGYGSKTLLYRTYGKLPWAIARGFEKLKSRG